MVSFAVVPSAVVLFAVVLFAVILFAVVLAHDWEGMGLEFAVALDEVLLESINNNIII